MWTDAWVSSDSHKVEDFISNYPSCIRATLGYYLGENNGYVFIAETDDRLSNTDADVERINAIPVKMVLEMNSLARVKVASTASAPTPSRGSGGTSPRAMGEVPSSYD